MSDVDVRIEAHYGRGDMAAKIFAVLEEDGHDLSALTLEDLTPFDEMHVRGRQATAELAGAAGFANGMHILDVGCGLGGPTRFVAATHGCRVTGIDLTADFVQSAQSLAAKVGLSELVGYRQASALDLPFADAGFDGAWSQHVQMNIADKPGLYREIARVLKPGARFAVYDILAGPAGPPHYPCPWAPQPEISFLIEPAPWRALLEASGFEIEHWRDPSSEGLAWFAEMADKAKADPHAATRRERVVGPELRARIGNLRRSLEENRVVLIEAVSRRT